MWLRARLNQSSNPYLCPLTRPHRVLLSGWHHVPLVANIQIALPDAAKGLFICGSEKKKKKMYLLKNLHANDICPSVVGPFFGRELFSPSVKCQPLTVRWFKSASCQLIKLRPLLSSNWVPHSSSLTWSWFKASGTAPLRILKSHSLLSLHPSVLYCTSRLTLSKTLDPGSLSSIEKQSEGKICCGWSRSHSSHLLCLEVMFCFWEKELQVWRSSTFIGSQNSVLLFITTGTE